MSSTITTEPSPAASKLADLIEQHAPDFTSLVVAALRGQSAAAKPAVAEISGSATSELEAEDDGRLAPGNNAANSESQPGNPIEWNDAVVIGSR